MADKVESQPKPVNPRRRRIVFRLAAVAVGLLPFVVLEVALRAFDAGNPTGYTDPFVGFSQLHPQFEKNEDKGVYETTHSRQLFFGRQEFAIEKPQNGYRVFCLGGSTVRGRPYTVETAFAKWMQLELSSTDPSRKYEVVNCGGLSYASYRLAAMLKEILQYEPDAIVLATGHNEFLEDRTFKAIKEQPESQRWLSEKFHSLRTVTTARRIIDDWRGKKDQPEGRDELDDRLQTRLDEESGYASYHRDKESREWRDKVVRHYDIALRGMVKMCDEAGVPLILVHLGSNLRDCPPFKSEPSPDLGENGFQKDKTWRSAFALATLTERNELKAVPDKFDLETALTVYREAEKIDGEHALLCYRIARIHDRLGHHKKAQAYYLKAKDNDVCPLRMLESMSPILKNIAAETNTPLVDARKLLEDESPQGIPGNNFYLDHVHPTIGGHQRIAQAIVARLREENIAERPAAAWTASARRRVYEQHIARLGENYYGQGFERVNWLENWAQRDRHQEERFPNDLRGYLDFAHRMANLGFEGKAWNEYEFTLKEHPEIAVSLLERALELFRQGRTPAAQFLLERLAGATTGLSAAEAHFATAVIALESDDKKAAAIITTKNGKDFDKIPADAPWRKAFPKAIQELKGR